MSQKPVRLHSSISWTHYREVLTLGVEQRYPEIRNSLEPLSKSWTNTTLSQPQRKHQLRKLGITAAMVPYLDIFVERRGARLNDRYSFSQVQEIFALLLFFLILINFLCWLTDKAYMETIIFLPKFFGSRQALCQGFFSRYSSVPAWRKQRRVSELHFWI